MLRDGLAGLPARIRDGRVLDKQIEAAKRFANLFRGRSNRRLIRYIELERGGTPSNFFGRGLAPRYIAGAKEYGDAICHEFLRDLQTDTLIGAGDEGDAFMFIIHHITFRPVAFIGQSLLYE
jgi:hypothetical protein